MILQWTTQVSRYDPGSSFLCDNSEGASYYINPKIEGIKLQQRPDAKDLRRECNLSGGLVTHGGQKILEWLKRRQLRHCWFFLACLWRCPMDQTGAIVTLSLSEKTLSPIISGRKGSLVLRLIIMISYYRCYYLYPLFFNICRLIYYPNDIS